MSDSRELSAFYAEAADVEERLSAAKDARAAAKANGTWDPHGPEGVELAEASEAMNAFRAYWRPIGAYQRELAAAAGEEPADGAVFVSPSVVTVESAPGAPGAVTE